MKTMLLQLNNMVGTYTGHGINHEGQPFVGHLELSKILDGKGLSLKFSAIGIDGTLYHNEDSTIAPSLQESLTLWNLNTNSPCLIPHEIRRTKKNAEGWYSLTFGFNNPDDKNTFREEITLELLDSSSLSYSYSWGLPGGDFKERSGAKMKKLTI